MFSVRIFTARSETIDSVVQSALNSDLSGGALQIEVFLFYFIYHSSYLLSMDTQSFFDTSQLLYKHKQGNNGKTHNIEKIRGGHRKTAVLSESEISMEIRQ